jgi:hypothetical protein
LRRGGKLWAGRATLDALPLADYNRTRRGSCKDCAATNQRLRHLDQAIIEQAQRRLGRSGC